MVGDDDGSRLEIGGLDLDGRGDGGRRQDSAPPAIGKRWITVQAPSAAVLLNVDAQPDPVTLIKRPVTCTTDITGKLRPITAR